MPTPSVDPKTGKGVIEVSPTEAGTSYAILDKGGKEVTGVTAYEKADDGKLTPLVKDKGWAATSKPNSTIVFQPVLPGQEYIVVKTKDTSTTPEDAKAAGTKTTVPVVGGNVSTSAPDSNKKFQSM